MQLLTLPKSQLTLREGELIKSGPDDVVVARFPTEQISRLGLEPTRSYGAAFGIVLVLLALAMLAHLHIASPGWSALAILACLAGCACVVLGIEGRELVIETANGEARYPISDLFDEAEGFVLSANGLLGLGPAADQATPAERRAAG